MSKDLLLTALLGLPLAVALAALWVNRRSGRPSGNVKGTRWESSEPLRRWNVALLCVLVLACTAGMAVVHFR